MNWEKIVKGIAAAVATCAALLIGLVGWFIWGMSYHPPH